MFAWFSFKKPFVRVHVRPPVLQDHEKDLTGYARTNATVSIPVNQEVPIALVRKLVKASLRVMKEKSG